MRVEGARGPFERVDDHADYRVENPACVPLTAVTGATVVPEQHLPLNFTRIAHGDYGTDVVLDRFLDEYYFGQEVCHWALVGVVADFHLGEADFSPSIAQAGMLAGREISRYFSVGSHARTSQRRIDTDGPTAYNDPRATAQIRVQTGAVSVDR